MKLKEVKPVVVMVTAPCPKGQEEVLDAKSFSLWFSRMLCQKPPWSPIAPWCSPFPSVEQAGGSRVLSPSLLTPQNSFFLCCSEGGKEILVAQCPELKFLFPCFVFPTQAGSGCPPGATVWAPVSAGSFALCRIQGDLRDLLNARRAMLCNISG